MVLKQLLILKLGNETSSSELINYRIYTKTTIYIQHELVVCLQAVRGITI